jgi:hypothetical protein
MKCEDYRVQLPEYWEGSLEEEEKVALEMHLASCSGCRSEADTLAGIWHGLGRIPVAQPSRDLRRRFYERLDSYQQGFLENAPTGSSRAPGLMDRLRAWLPMRPAFQAAFAAVLLVIGFFAGYGIDRRGDTAQVSQLRSEVNNMRQLVALSLMQQQNASDRLKGVNWAFRVEESDTEVLAALLRTLNHDSNVNVRLAAVDALHAFSDSPVARKGLVQAIGKQESPMVQVALIDAVADLRDQQAAGALRALANDSNANPEVRERAHWALAKLAQ